MAQHISFPLEGTWDQAAKQEVTSYRDPLPPLWTGWLIYVQVVCLAVSSSNHYTRKVSVVMWDLMDTNLGMADSMQFV